MLVAGSIFDGRYEIIGKLSEGGMGEVYKAVQKDLGRVVALKVISGRNFSTESIQRLEREAIALGALKHQSIVSVYGYGFCEGVPYISMEYVQGRTLQHLLADNKPLPVNDVLQIMRELAEAVSYTHKHGVIHRDLKPANVMMPEEDGRRRIKLIDLGLVRILPDFGRNVQTLTKSGCAVGSVLYMSPEQCLGEKADQRSDIYSLGVILYQCLTGRTPFVADNAVTAMMLQLNEKPTLLSEVAPSSDVPGMQSVVFKAMAKMPEERYQNVDQMIADLELIASNNGQAITSFHKIESKIEARRERKSQNKLVVLASLTVLLAVLVGGLAASVRSKTSVDLLNESTEVWKHGNRERVFDLALAALKKNREDKLLNERLGKDPVAIAALRFGLSKRDPRLKEFLEAYIATRPTTTVGSYNEWVDWLLPSNSEIDQWRTLLTVLNSINNPDLDTLKLMCVSRAPCGPGSRELIQPVDLLLSSLPKIGDRYSRDLDSRTYLFDARITRFNLLKSAGLVVDAKRQLDKCYSRATADQEPDSAFLELARCYRSLENWSMVLRCLTSMRSKLDSHLELSMEALERLGHHQEAMKLIPLWKEERSNTDGSNYFTEDVSLPINAMFENGYKSDAMRLLDETRQLVLTSQPLLEKDSKRFVEFVAPLPADWYYRNVSYSYYSDSVSLAHSGALCLNVGLRRPKDNMLPNSLSLRSTRDFLDREERFGRTLHRAVAGHRMRYSIDAYDDNIAGKAFSALGATSLPLPAADTRHVECITGIIELANGQGVRVIASAYGKKPSIDFAPVFRLLDSIKAIH